MLPHTHFIIASVAITPAAIVLSPERSVGNVVAWILVGGLISAAIDLDICTLVLLKSKRERRLQPFRNPLTIHRRFKEFMDTITETGLLKLGIKTHLVFSTLVILLFYFLCRTYFIPVTIGVVSHLISDIPNLRRKERSETG